MKTYHSGLILERSTDELQDERLFDRFNGRVSSAVVNGPGLLCVHLEAPAMELAILEAVQAARALNVSVRRVELDPDTVPAHAA